MYPSHGWLRFGYQKGVPQDRYRVIYQESGLPLILFQYPQATKATYDLETQLDISAKGRLGPESAWQRGKRHSL